MAHDVEGATGAGEALGVATPSPLVLASILRDLGGTGVQTHVQELRAYLIDHGVPAPLLTPFSWGGPLSVPVFGLRPLVQQLSPDAGVVWYRHWHELFLRRALSQQLAQMDDVILYAHGPESARACLSARKSRRQRVVMAVHYDTSQTENWVERGMLRRDGRAFDAIRKMERRIIPQLDAIIYVSRWAREQVWRWLPEAAQVPHAIIHNFVKSAGTPSAQPPLGDLVTVGALQATKRHQFLIEALAAAKGMGHVLTLDIYGDGPLRPRLEQSARALGLEGQVRFKGFRPDVRKFLAGYRLYVHACAVETGPIAIIEALAAGLPVVAPNVGGIPELYDDGIEGRYCSVDNSAEMAHNIVEVLADEATRRRYAAAASERFQSNFDVEVVAPRLLSFLFTHPARPVASVEDLTVPGLQVP